MSMNKTLVSFGVVGILVSLAALVSLLLVASAPPPGGQQYTIHLPIIIEGAQGDKIDAVNRFARFLQNTKPEDTVTLVMAGYGGEVETYLMLADAVQNAPAKVIGRVVGPVFSAHAMLTCVVDEIHIKPHSFLMFHPVQGPRPVDKDYAAIVKMSTTYMTKYCADLLTPEQITGINGSTGADYVDQVEVYVTAEDLKNNPRVKVVE